MSECCPIGCIEIAMRLPHSCPRCATRGGGQHERNASVDHSLDSVVKLDRNKCRTKGSQSIPAQFSRSQIQLERAKAEEACWAWTAHREQLWCASLAQTNLGRPARAFV